MRGSLLFRSAAIMAASAVPLAAIAAQEPGTEDKPIIIGPVHSTPPPPPIPANLAARSVAFPLLDAIRERQGADDYVASLEKEVREADLDADGLDRADVELFHQMDVARQGSRALGQAMAYDLDGDFRVTLAEIERSMTSGGIVRQQEAEHRLEQFDKDGNRVITLDEARRAMFLDTREDSRLAELLALDPNPADNLTRAEVDTMARTAFHIVDQDHDGTISADERAAIWDQVYLARWLRATPVCPLPPAPKEAKLVAFSTSGGQAVSSAAIGGLDEATELVDVTIEPGEKPLYLVLTSHNSVIWRFAGHTERISQAVVHTYIPAMPAPGSGIKLEDGRPRIGEGMSAGGVIGLPAETVSIEPTNCFPSTGTDEALAAQIERGAGHKVDAQLTARVAQAVAFPSGKVREYAEKDRVPPPAGFDAFMWQGATNAWPAGPIEVDPAKVVAAAPVEATTVLPGKFGVSQLAGSGAIVKQRNGAWLITRPIEHFPARLEGYHYTMMILPRGMAMPAGIPPRCLIHEELMPEQGPICPGPPPPPPKTRKSKP